jgi:hypothetical protein
MASGWRNCAKWQRIYARKIRGTGIIFFSLCQPEIKDKTEVEVANVEPPGFKLAPSRGQITLTIHEDLEFSRI